MSLLLLTKRIGIVHGVPLVTTSRVTDVYVHLQIISAEGALDVDKLERLGKMLVSGSSAFTQEDIDNFHAWAYRRLQVFPVKP